MKPNWSDAPEWASWLAMDQDGAWYWYETQPVLGSHHHLTISGKCKSAETIGNWQESLEQRPR